ncbi:EspA/EspE family type VII secretion system effector [Mycobacterium sp. 050134]|uniref:EspA/EspE family type VII secretion system effector n=1 Tax=Mycobacterium sp. 050134 TaxID=3096111 RepID=UPI002ED8ABA9
MANGMADAGSVIMLLGPIAKYTGVRNLAAANWTRIAPDLNASSWGIDLISWTYVAVEFLNLTTGFIPPYEGAGLNTGSKTFAELSQLLRSAVPGETWDGSGSDAYAQLSATLQQLAVTAAELDAKFADAVEDQAKWITHYRLGFGLLKDLLVAAMVIEWLLTYLEPGPAGQLKAKAFAVAVAVAGIATATGFIATLVACSFDARAKAEDLTNQYRDLLPQIDQKGRLAQPSVANAAESAVSDFEGISNSMSGSAGSAPSPRAFRAAQGPAAYRTNTDDTAAQTTPSTTTAAAGIASFALPTVTMPTLAQVTTMSGQSARISGQLAQHVNLFNQAMGQVQQIAQMAQQNQPAPPPAPDAETATDVNAETGEDTDAAAGSPDGQRAPVAQTAPGTPPAQPRGEQML